MYGQRESAIMLVGVAFFTVIKELYISHTTGRARGNGCGRGYYHVVVSYILSNAQNQPLESWMKFNYFIAMK